MTTKFGQQVHQDVIHQVEVHYLRLVKKLPKLPKLRDFEKLLQLP